MSISQECACYHEAGHAVAWVVNGDTILLVVGRSDAKLTVEQEAVRNQRRHSAGETIREGREISSCEKCGGTELNDSCPACVKVFVDHLTCFFAGGAATALLLPDEHARSQMSDDLAQIDKLLSKFLESEPQRKDLRNEAEQRAANLIRRETKAVRETAGQLLVHGVLDGAVAEEIILRNLQGSGF